MKAVVFYFLISSSLLLGACQGETDATTLRKSTEQKILGKWKLVKAIEEEYMPLNTLRYMDEYIGTTGDSVVFSENNIVYTYSPVSGDIEEEYSVVNGQQIVIESEVWWIQTLTDKEFILKSEENDASQNTRYVQKIIMAR